MRFSTDHTTCPVHAQSSPWRPSSGSPMHLPAQVLLTFPTSMTWWRALLSGPLVALDTVLIDCPAVSRREFRPLRRGSRLLLPCPPRNPELGTRRVWLREQEARSPPPLCGQELPPPSGPSPGAFPKEVGEGVGRGSSLVALSTLHRAVHETNVLQRFPNTAQSFPCRLVFQELPAQRARLLSHSAPRTCPPYG